MSLAMSGCSPGADYPSIFQAVHNTPPPGADTTLDADQVQQATETLITERNQLSAAAQASGQTKTPANSSNPAAAGNGQGGSAAGAETK